MVLHILGVLALTTTQARTYGIVPKVHHRHRREIRFHLLSPATFLKLWKIAHFFQLFLKFWKIARKIPYSMLLFRGINCTLDTDIH
jgi:hypothetical protein